jgi:hypothetical protein
VKKNKKPIEIKGVFLPEDAKLPGLRIPKKEAWDGLKTQTEVLTRKGQVFIRETYPVTTKKYSPIDIERNNKGVKWDKLASYKNYKGEWLNIMFNKESPFKLFFCPVGGPHKFGGFTIDIVEMEMLIKLWKFMYQDWFGVRPRIPRQKTLMKILEKNKMSKIIKWLGMSSRGRRKKV